MTAQGLLITPAGSTGLRTIDGYRDIVEAVGGDFDWTSPGEVTMYCYEYALFERENNPVATALYRTTHPGIEDPMHGPVLVMGPPVNEDDSDVPEEIVARVAAIREQLGDEQIAKLAVPMTSKEQMDFQMKMISAQNAATRALNEGRGVDFGGILIGVDQPSSESFDGNRRQGKNR